MKTPDKQGFSDALSAALEARKMSQAELARRLGMERGRVHRWFDGTAPDDPSVVVAIAEALDIEPSVLTLHLGYLPATDEHVTITTPEDAILADPQLGAEDRTFLLKTLARARQSPSSGTGLLPPS